MLACDFFITVTAAFRVLYVFVVLEVGTRRILHWNVTDHPTAEWTAQQFRMVVTGDQSHRFVVHDHDSIYSEAVDRTLAAMGLTVLKTPVRAPQANAFCERLIGTIRRECLDFVIPLNERHVRSVLREWVWLLKTPYVLRLLMFESSLDSLRADDFRPRLAVFIVQKLASVARRTAA